MANTERYITKEDLDKLREVAEAAKDNELVSAFFSATREFLSAILAELEEDKELSTMPLDEAFDSGKFDALIERAASRIGTAEASKEAREVREALPRLTSIVPRKHVSPVNKLANSIREIIDTGELDLTVMDKGKPTEVNTRCMVSYEGDNVTLSGRQSFTEYDRSVADAVTSLYLYGDSSHIVTPASVYRAMVHATEGETPSPQQIGAVTKSLDKLRFIRVRVNLEDEFRRRDISLNGEQIVDGEIDTYLLALTKLKVNAGGKSVSAYQIMSTPILYEYAHLIGQVNTVDAKLLDIRDETGAKVANTEQRIEIKGYLLRRIEAMKGKSGNRRSRNITYADLYKNLAEEEPSRKKQQQIREYVEKCLDSWKRDGYIHGYEDLMRGRSKYGVSIKT